jgi:hypothetical protein
VQVAILFKQGKWTVFCILEFQNLKFVDQTWLQSFNLQPHAYFIVILTVAFGFIM